MEFEVQSPEVLWRDFSTTTSQEYSTRTIDFILRKFSKSINHHQVEQFMYKNQIFTARIYPPTYSKIKDAESAENSKLSYPDSIRFLFRIKTPFFVITSGEGYENRIGKDTAHNLSSTILPACDSSNFFMPVFINIPLKMSNIYIGMSISSDKKYVKHFYSETKWDSESCETFANFDKSNNFFVSKFGPFDSHFASLRQTMVLTNSDFPKNAEHKYSSFYSKINADPIKKLTLFFQWNKFSPNSFHPVPSNSSYLKVYADFDINGERKTNLHMFVKKKPSIDKQDDFKIWLTSKRNSKCMSLINNLFSSDSNLSHKKRFFKSAPSNSLLEKLSICIAEMELVANFAILWTEFLKEIRNHAENKTPIPSVNDDVDYSYCLIYQNLQIINCCINHNDEPIFYMSENTFSQYAQVFLKSKNQEILKMLIKVFKMQKSKNTLDDFKSFFIQCINEISSENAFNFDEIFDQSMINELFTRDDYHNTFQSTEIIELALDYLESLKPSEVYNQIVLVLFDYVYSDISVNIMPEIPFIQTSFDTLQNEYKNLQSNLNYDSYRFLCRVIEDTRLKIEIVNSLLIKIPSAPFVIELLEKKFCSTESPTEISYIANLIQVLNLDDVFKKIDKNEYIFTGSSKDDLNDHYLFASRQKMDNQTNKVILAWSICEKL